MPSHFHDLTCQSLPEAAVHITVLRGGITPEARSLAVWMATV